MQEQDTFAWFTSQFATVWWWVRKGIGMSFSTTWPELAFVASTGNFDRSGIEESPAFFERRSYYEYDGPDKHRRIYHISRGRPARGPSAIRIINEDIKSNNQQHEVERRDDCERENEDTWKALKNRIRRVIAKSARLMNRIWLVAIRLRALLHNQSIWVFQQRRIRNAIGHEAQCAVLSQRNALIVNRGDVVTGDSVLLALKSHALSDLLHSVERGHLTVTNSRQTNRQAEYRLDRWWPPYI